MSGELAECENGKKATGLRSCSTGIIGNQSMGLQYGTIGLHWVQLSKHSIHPIWSTRLVVHLPAQQLAKMRYLTRFSSDSHDKWLK